VPQILLSIPIALLVLAACHEAGRIVLRILSRDGLLTDPLEEALARLATGYVSIEFTVAVLAFLHLLQAPILWALIALLCISALIFGRRGISKTFGAVIATWTGFFRLPLNGILASIALLALGMDFVLTLTPTTAWDALTYHYVLPYRWLLAGGFAPLPDIAYHELPAATEMLFATAFAMGGVGPDRAGPGVLAGNHLTWATGALVVLALIAIGRRITGLTNGTTQGINWDSSTPGLVAGLAYLSLPIIYVEAMEGGYVDNFLVFLSLALILLLLCYKEKLLRNLIPVIGIIGGGLLATKHNALVLDALVLGALVVWIIQGAKRRSGQWSYLLSAIVLALVLPLPWYLKSWLQTGNPVYPFANQLFQSGRAAPDIMYWSNPNVFRSVIGLLAWIPRLTTDESLVQIRMRLLTWYFVPMLPFAIWFGIVTPKARIVALATWVYILLVYFIAPGEPRYALFAWALYALLGAWGVLLAFRTTPWFAKIVLPLLLVLPIGWSLVGMTGELNRRIPAILGLESVDEYYEKSFDVDSLIRFINRDTPADSVVIMMEPRVFPVNRKYIIWYPFPSPPTEDWADLDTAGILARWRELGAQYVVVTFGPNYRAIALVEALVTANRHAHRASPFDDLPEWVFTRAAYAEPELTRINRLMDGLDETDSLGARRQQFDLKSVQLLWRLYEVGALERAYVDDRAGTVFRIVYPEGDTG
jgi:hypothetical protein